MDEGWFGSMSLYVAAEDLPAGGAIRELSGDEKIGVGERQSVVGRGKEIAAPADAVTGVNRQAGAAERVTVSCRCECGHSIPHNTAIHIRGLHASGPPAGRILKTGMCRRVC
jgi:hypothetical protein